MAQTGGEGGKGEDNGGEEKQLIIMSSSDCLLLILTGILKVSFDGPSPVESVPL